VLSTKNTGEKKEQNWVIEQKEQTCEFRSRISRGRLLRLRSMRQRTCNTTEISLGLSSSFEANQTQLAATSCKDNRTTERLELGNKAERSLQIFERHKNDEQVLITGSNHAIQHTAREKTKFRKVHRIHHTLTLKRVNDFLQ
jgi:hypothetical protein